MFDGKTNKSMSNKATQFNSETGRAAGKKQLLPAIVDALQQ